MTWLPPKAFAPGRWWLAATPLVLIAVPGAPTMAQTAVLSGATVIDGTGAPPIRNGVVVVEGDRITCVGTQSRCAPPADAQRYDLTGRFLTPGLVDAHVHFSQTGWLDGRPDGLAAPDLYPYAETARALEANPARWYRSYLCTGITAVFDVGGHPWTTALPAASEDDPDAVHVRAAGPLITHARVPALNADEERYTFLPMETPEEVEESVRRLVAMGSTAVKVWYVRAPEDRRAELDARVMQIGAIATRSGLDLIVHATNLREAKVALRAGAVLLVHSVQNAPVDDEFLDLMRANGTIYAPTLVVGGNWSRARASVMLDQPQPIDDPNQCVDADTRTKIGNTSALRALLPDNQRSPEVGERMMERGRTVSEVMRDNLRRVHQAGLVIATATDAGNPMTLHGPSIYNEMEAMQDAGLAASDIVVMSTRNGAQAMDRLDDFGTLEPGKIADILVLAANPLDDVSAFRSLTHIMRAGRMRSQGELTAPR